MRLLILTQDYPSKKSPHLMTFVHTRSLYYKKYGVELDIVSFNCKKYYVFEDVKIYPPSELKFLLHRNYHAVISHSPNIRLHLTTILLHFLKLPKIFFVYHGHEVIVKCRYYPLSYKPTLSEYITRYLIYIYDIFKCKLWKILIKIYGGKKFYLIFVSKYMRSLFLENIHLKRNDIVKFSQVIHNPVSPEILKLNYKYKFVKKHDFITIRRLNDSIYALDLLIELAKSNPQFNFHIYGKGKLNLKQDIPKNVKIYSKSFTHDQLPALFNMYKAGIMLSRHDSQGVMACDMSAYGLPLIVSDIHAAREMFSNCEKVYFMNNDCLDYDLEKILKKISKTKPDSKLRKKLDPNNTALKELQFVMDNFFI